MKYDSQMAFKVTGGALIVNYLKRGDKILISEHSTDGTSLTNAIEGVIEGIADRFDEFPKDITWYQWCEGEGLFELELGDKINRSMPNFQVKSWIKLSNELTAFEVLFT